MVPLVSLPRSSFKAKVVEPPTISRSAGLLMVSVPPEAAKSVPTVIVWPFTVKLPEPMVSSARVVSAPVAVTVPATLRMLMTPRTVTPLPVMRTLPGPVTVPATSRLPATLIS